MSNENPYGIGVGVGNIDVLKNTDIGVLRGKMNGDKSKYKRTTKPDGTVVEEVKMNKINANGGVVDLFTDGVNLGDRSVDVGISNSATEDAVSFVDSIWGSRAAAGVTAETRKEKVKLEQFKAQRDLQLSEDHKKRVQMAQMENPEETMGRAI